MQGVDKSEFWLHTRTSYTPANRTASGLDCSCLSTSTCMDTGSSDTRVA